MECFLNDKFKCDSKRSDLEQRYSSDPNSENKINHILLAHRNNSGCDKFLDKPLHYIENFGFNSCLCNFKNSLIHYFLVVVDNYDLGVMPHEGCLSDQSARLLDIIFLIKRIRQENTDKLRAELEKQR